MKNAPVNDLVKYLCTFRNEVGRNELSYSLLRGRYGGFLSIIIIIIIAQYCSSV